MFRSSSGIPIPLSITFIYASLYTNPTYIFIVPPVSVYILHYLIVYLILPFLYHLYLHNRSFHGSALNSPGIFSSGIGVGIVECFYNRRVVFFPTDCRKRTGADTFQFNLRRVVVGVDSTAADGNIDGLLPDISDFQGCFVAELEFHQGGLRPSHLHHNRQQFFANRFFGGSADRQQPGGICNSGADIFGSLH